MTTQKEQSASTEQSETQKQGFDFIEMEKKWLKHWYETGITSKYLTKNDKSKEYFSFQDGPITANNPMGVHHAWGRNYKDLWQKFHNLLGHKQRFQNGFDCQGLWVEVEVEKELGLKTKKDIENLVPGNREESIAKFVQMCKDRVYKFSGIQTEQSKRLGYFMDWDHSYFTMSDENNYMIWHFLKKCQEHGWIYKGHDSVPWCPRCETAISQHEMLTEDYKELTHETIFFKLPIQTKGWENTNLLVWTTTPWTVPANVAVGVNTSFIYGIYEEKTTKERIIFISKDENNGKPVRQLKNRELPVDTYIFDKVEGEYELVKELKGTELLGLSYEAPFDFLPRVQEAKNDNPNKFHTVVDGSDIVVSNEGTGLLHVAPGAGQEDFQLGKKENLAAISLIADNADYLDGMNEFSGKNAKKHPELIIDFLKSTQNGRFLHKTLHYTHRYPACWRCKTELVWKIADEWYISMDKPSKMAVDGQATMDDSRTLRERMVDVAKKITWMPEFGLDRELDWLKNMHDWLISKKNRYWGLSLPIYECPDCGTFEVIGSKEELKERAVSGWDSFDGHSPHKPYIDNVVIACKTCKKELHRIQDVGNPWLDAGIVPYSTISDHNDGQPLYLKNRDEWKKWFPVNFITESFPGQFKNWFYAMIAMSTVLEDTNPFERVLGFATQLGEDGRPMHKSWGNSIEFNEGADKIGVDVMRWMFSRHNPADNMLFGYKKADEVRRMFYLMLWNTYKFYDEYAKLDGFNPGKTGSPIRSGMTDSVLDLWIQNRLDWLNAFVKKSLLEYNAKDACLETERFLNDVSTWYIRRSRNRVTVHSEDQKDKESFYATLHRILADLMVMLSPMMPFVTEEIYKSLTNEESVHLASWPKAAITPDETLFADMQIVRDVAEAGQRVRKEHKLKVRQPLASMTVTLPEGRTFAHKEYQKEYDSLLADELNVKKVEWKSSKSDTIEVVYDTNLTPELIVEGELRDLVRQIQALRKDQGAKMIDKVAVTVPEKFKDFSEQLKKQVSASTITYGAEVKVEKV